MKRTNVKFELKNYVLEKKEGTTAVDIGVSSGSTNLVALPFLASCYHFCNTEQKALSTGISKLNKAIGAKEVVMLAILK